MTNTPESRSKLRITLAQILLAFAVLLAGAVSLAILTAPHSPVDPAALAASP